MQRQKSTKVIAIIALIVAVIGISIGFAAMSTTLNIQGTTEFNPATWSIKFANLGTPSLTGAASVVTAPTINGVGNTTIGTYKVSLTKPGDSVTYTFDIQNTGSINAVLTNITKAATPTCTGTGATAAADATIVCNNLVWTFKYTSGGANVANGDTLNAGTTKNVTLKIEYPLAVSQLPTAKVDITNLGITLLYTQS